MVMHIERSQIPGSPVSARVYSPDILPRLQHLLAALADVDAALERDLEAIHRSPVRGRGKDRLVADLRRHHREQRTPYVQELAALSERMRATLSGADGAADL